MLYSPGGVFCQPGHAREAHQGIERAQAVRLSLGDQEVDGFTFLGQQEMPGVIQFQDPRLGNHDFHRVCSLAQTLEVGTGSYPRRGLPAAQQVNDDSLFHHALHENEIKERQTPRGMIHADKKNP